MPQKVIAVIAKILTGLERLRDVALLVPRVFMAKVFFLSGLTKFNDWSNTLFLFAEEYKVPIIPFGVAAVMATAAELLCPVLLVLGLGTRAAALALLGMTGVIQFTYLDHADHYYWAMLLGLLLCFGAGRLSLDYPVRRIFLPTS
ncbi:MAG: DoxX family protein [Alphaproteobacteria bacterium]